MVDIDNQIAYPVDVCLSFEEGKWEMEELLDHQAILRDQSAFVEIDSIVGNVKDEGVSTVKYFDAFVVYLLRGTEEGSLSRNPDDSLLCLIRSFDC